MTRHSPHYGSDTPQSPRRICHVCSGHSLDDGRVFHRTCVSLAQAGYDVHLIATGDAVPGTVRAGVRLHGLPQAASRWRRLSRRYEVARLAGAVKPALFHVHEPELLGPTLAQAGTHPVIWDVHESYLDVLGQRSWIPKLLRPIARQLWDLRERLMLKRCAAVVVVTDRIASRYRALHREVVVVGNNPDLSAIPPPPSRGREPGICVFAGGLSEDRGLLEVMEALALLQKRGVHATLRLAGPSEDSFLQRLMNRANELNVESLVSYHGILTKAEAFTFQNDGAIGLVTYLPRPNSMAGKPTKLVECMAMSLPVVFSNFPNYIEVAGVTGSGIAVDPTKPEVIADALERLIKTPDLRRAMGLAGRRAAEEQFSWDSEKGRLLELYSRILGHDRRL
jgi:glycosyltransferase involved in cell wall biosynthesis